MSFAEFTAVIDKRVAWRVLFKVAITIISSCAGFVIVAFGPVLWVYGNVNGNVKDVARLEDQVRGLTQTVGGLQIQVAGIGAELKVMKSEQTRGTEEILRRLEPPARAAVAPPRTANVPTRRATQ